MSITKRECKDAELKLIEEEWQSDGITLVSNINDENQLNQSEYIKCSHSGDLQSAVRGIDSCRQIHKNNQLDTII